MHSQQEVEGCDRLHLFASDSTDANCEPSSYGAKRECLDIGTDSITKDAGEYAMRHPAKAVGSKESVGQKSAARDGVTEKYYVNQVRA